MDLSDIKKAIESIIFISDQPVSVDKLSLAFPNVERAQLRKCLKELVTRLTILIIQIPKRNGKQF